jgi:hypothetical protein
MATIYKWSGVGVAVQSALGSNLTISAITKANPGVASSTAHALSDGEIVVLTILGMNQVNDRVVRVDNAAADAFDLEGVDTTLYDTFVSGTANEITFGTTLSTLVDLTASGGDFDFIDTTTIHDTVRSQIPGTAAPASYSFTSLWDPADAGLIALKAAADAQAKRAIRFSWPNGARLYFNGYVGATMLPTGTAQGRVETPVTITMQGRSTFYAS